MPKNVEGVSDWWAERAVKEEIGGIEGRMNIVFEDALMVDMAASIRRGELVVDGEGMDDTIIYLFVSSLFREKFGNA